ncbi:MAG TPA: helix-turn-helix domain-containing protein [Ruminococcus sp.]
MSRLLPYETILKAREGDPEAVNAVLLHYAGYIRYFSKVNGQVNAECCLTRKIQKIDTQNTKKSTLCKKSLLILMSRGFF